MEYIPAENLAATTGKILCCQCGTAVDPNPANMCIACLRTQVDITEGIPKQGTLHFCRGCDRYLNPPNQWLPCALESKELLSLCLKKLKGLSKVHLVDAGFVWTEPHSKRIKVKLTIQKEVFGGAILQQIFVVEFLINHQMCDLCHRREAKDFWRALVQVRQKTEHKKTFFYLEQLILKQKAHQNCVNIKACHSGLDFFYARKDDARKLVDFIMAVAPCRYVTSQQLISHDVHSNIFNYKHTFCVEIVPICKEDVVCLGLQLAKSLGNIGQICICQRVTNSIQLIDPNTLQVADISGTMFWRQPFGALCGRKQLTEFIVMDVELVRDSERKKFAGQGPRSEKHALADVWLVRSSQLGTSEEHIHTRTHLGHFLKPGHTVLGFDITRANTNDPNFEKMRQDRLPDVILVKVIFGDRASRNRKRKWKLKHLEIDAETETSSVNRDYEDFLEDLEEDPNFRQNVNIYVDRDKLVSVETDTDDDDVPKISLQEMLEDLTLEDMDTENLSPE